MAWYSYPIWLLSMVLPPLRWIVLAVNYRWYRKRCGALWLVDPRADKECSDFYDQIEKALRFIREHDSRRANWIEKHLNYITRADYVDSGGRYVAWNKNCQVNYSAYYQNVAGSGELTEQTQYVLTLELAAIIIHEATHGRIHDAGIAYAGERRERIERCCRRQEIQFLRRAAPGLKDVDGKLVDWSTAKEFENCREFYECYWQQSDAFYLWERIWLAGKIIIQHFTAEKESKSWRKMHNFHTKFAENYQPRTEGMLYSRGEHHFAAKNFRQAIADFQTFLKEERSFRHARFFVAFMLCCQQQWEESLRLWKQAYEHDEKCAAIWIASILFRQHRYAEALEWLERETNEDNTNFAHWHGRILCGLDRYEDALQSYDRGLTLEDDIELGSESYSMLAERALLLRKLDMQTRFQSDCQRLQSIADQHWASCDTTTMTVDACVVKTHPEIYESDILSVEALLLICTDFVGQPRQEGYLENGYLENGYLENIADKLLESLGSDSNEYESLYLRSLLQSNEAYPWREVPESLTGGKQV